MKKNEEKKGEEEKKGKEEKKDFKPCSETFGFWNRSRWHDVFQPPFLQREFHIGAERKKMRR